MPETPFEPKIVAFLCRWCAGAGADLAGTSRIAYPANAVPIRVNCSGRVEPEWVMEAFRSGADGVFIGGCHPGDCHYVSGNYKTRRRIYLLKKLLAEMGIEPERVRLEWVSATEGAKYARVMKEFVAELKRLGPLHLEREEKTMPASPVLPRVGS
ncbi:hydrogenase iron-sulfur subunit [Candidatus Bipolaricaulota bacterium]|nr:hydrogenase iron-sulfur subunit [Candidatus Bipolaricaulota bacterium]